MIILKSKKASYEISDVFTIKPTKVSIDLLKKRDIVIVYSNKPDNKIVEILDITGRSIKTKYYPDWYPLVITKQCEMFYEDSVIAQRSERYNEFIRDLDRVKSLYRSMKSEYDMFTKYTSLTFNDMTSNNVLVNSDITDFRIIDVNSIVEPKNKGILGVPKLERCLGYYSFKHVSKDFFDKEEVDMLFEKCHGH